MQTLGRWALWWVGLALLWLFLQGEWNRIVIVGAFGCGAVAALLELGVRARARPATRVDWSWAARSRRLPWLIVKEFVQITIVLVRTLRRRRRHVGEFRAYAFPAGGPRPAERGRRALYAIAMGYSPNSYVLDVEEERKLVLVHVLDRVAAREELL